jgi:hypothetical protein
MTDKATLDLLSTLNQVGPLSPDEAVNTHGAPDGLLESLATGAIDAPVRTWVNATGDTGKYQLTAAGWSLLDAAGLTGSAGVDNTPSEG